MRIPKSTFLASLVTLLGLASLASALEPIRIVGTGARIAYTRFQTSGTSTAFWHRTPHQLGGPVDELDIGFMNWLHTSKTEMANTNVVTITHAWVERAATGQVLPLTFSGARNFDMPADSTQAYFLADPIPSTAWTGATPSRDELFWVSAKGSVATTGEFICQGTPSTYRDPANSSNRAKFCLYDPTNDPGTFDVAGPAPSIAGENTRTDGLPMVFLGRYTGPGHLSVVGIGDSIMTGSGDPANPVPEVSGYGFFNRAAVDGSSANTIAMLNVSRHGESAASWVSKHSFREQLLPFANVAVEEYATNDIGSNGGSADVNAIYGRLESIWADCQAAGIQKILRTTLFPRTTSVSYDWVSLEDQTPNAGWGDGEARDQINAMFPTAVAEGKIDGVVDTLSVTCDPTDTHYWFTDGTNDLMTSDGTHLRSAANIAAAAPLRAALLALTVDGPTETSYLNWSDSIEWSGGDSSPLADPNLDGVSNLICFATGADPLDAAAAADKLPTCGIMSDVGVDWLTFSYRERNNAAGLICSVISSETLAGWNELVPDGSAVILETLDSDPDGDGNYSLYQVKVNMSLRPDVRFLRLQVEL
ncbi:MAG: SGNH/GDSL hydrolase family protein [Verrucomicrobiae bacterium]|nr:SGNH/GDSL hydrolase family protein [Verrucomicrobiae bacterium]MCP5546872.1 SGNH/GDSL hydrolase family protein [Akkermansiaceae bacterium]